MLKINGQKLDLLEKNVFLCGFKKDYNQFKKGINIH